MTRPFAYGFVGSKLDAGPIGLSQSPGLPARSAKVRNDVPVLPRRPSGSRRPTMKLVNELRDEA